MGQFVKNTEKRKNNILEQLFPSLPDKCLFARIIGCTVQGRSHIQTNTPCQDKFHHANDNKIFVAALADGAGSASHSDTGAEIVTKTACTFMLEHFGVLQEKGEVIFKKMLLREILSSLDSHALDIGQTRADFATTLMMVAISGDCYIAVHVGDGVIGFTAEFSGAKLEVLSPPDRGEFANTTWFVTSQDAFDKTRVYSGELNDITGFICMTDGSMNSLYRRRNNQFAEAVRSFFSWHKEINNTKMEDVLLVNMKDSIASQTSDDCGIVLMCIHRLHDELELLPHIALDISECSTLESLYDHLEERNENLGATSQQLYMMEKLQIKILENI